MKEEKEEVKITERVEIKQEIHKESAVKTAKETSPEKESTVTTTDGRKEVFKMVAALVVFTLVAMLLLSFIPGVGNFKN